MIITEPSVECKDTEGGQNTLFALLYMEVEEVSCSGITRNESEENPQFEV